MARAKKYKSTIIDSIKKRISPSEKKKAESKMMLALKIKEAMVKKGLSNTKFAELMSKNNLSQVTKWLSGTHNFTHDTLVEIGEVLDETFINNKEKAHLTTANFTLHFKLENGSRLTMPKIEPGQIAINKLPTKVADC